jgi:hypothetical protein
VLGSPLGKLPAPAAHKAREKPALYDAVEFERQFTSAVDRSRRYVEAGLRFVESGDTDRFYREVPEGSIDG